MTRTRVRHRCTDCGAQSPRWLGRCPECGEWNTLVEEVEALQARGYNPHDIYQADEELKAVIDWLGSSYFTPHEGDAFGQLTIMDESGAPIAAVTGVHGLLGGEVDAARGRTG